MNTFPVITKEKQKFYENFCLNNSLFNNTPEICGYYGRACRNMGKRANSMLCGDCNLSHFTSTVEAILECCHEKENIGIENLYDSDIYDIQEKLNHININVKFSYIENILNLLVFQKEDES